jgi:indole-3-glycerol phosphate synthase
MAEGLGDLLSAVVAAARRSATEREQRAGRPALERAAAARTPRGSAFAESLGRDGIRVIAECKRRSPSRGVLRENYDPVAIATGYAAAGAAAISVLTEPTFFDGSIDHLRAVREAVTLPVLCKDFLVTESQLLEARAAGADAVLLIIAALDSPQLLRLSSVARSLGLAALVEVHDRDELQRAIDAGATIVGVNSRNLRTLEVSANVFDELVPRLPEGVIAVAESGLKAARDLARLRALRYNAFLIGERFMTEPDPGRALEDVRVAAERGVTA